MKRTKETFFRYHPHHTDREGMSGLKEFDGEDLGKIALKTLNNINKNMTQEFNTTKINRKTGSKSKRMKENGRIIERNMKNIFTLLRF